MRDNLRQTVLGFDPLQTGAEPANTADRAGLAAGTEPSTLPGLFLRLTREQQQRILSYDGPVVSGDPFDDDADDSSDDMPHSNGSAALLRVAGE